MGKLIDADVLKAELQTMYPQNSIGSIAAMIVCREIDEQPEAVIRCGKCKHWRQGYITDADIFVPPQCNKNLGEWGYSDYCSEGERKENGS